MLNTGIVSEYDANTKIYTVSVDYHSSVQARRILTGVDKPFPPRSRVVLLKLNGIEWAIIGEVDMLVNQDGLTRQRTADEEAAEILAVSKQIRDSSDLGELPKYRPEGEELQFLGDVSIENRTDRQQSRSRVKVFSFGSVISFASYLCHTLWDRRNNEIVQQSRALVERCIGFIRTIATPSDTRMSTVNTQVQGDAVSRKSGADATRNFVDVETTEGFLPAPAGRNGDLHANPKAKFGRRVKYRDHAVEEMDTETGVRRSSWVSGEGDSRVTEINSLCGDLNDVGKGYGRYDKYREWLEVTVDGKNRVYRIADAKNNQEFVITDSGITVKRGNNTVSLTDVGVTVSGDTVTIDSKGEIVLKGTNVRSELG